MAHALPQNAKVVNARTGVIADQQQLRPHSLPDYVQAELAALRRGEQEGQTALKQVKKRQKVTKIDAKGLLGYSSSRLAVFVENVYTASECQELIAMAEDVSFEPALINVGGGLQQAMPDYRNNDRAIIDDGDLALHLWQRIEQHVPRVFEGRRALGLNERLRFLRYDAGMRFGPHQDGMYMRPNRERSLVTVQFYLNEEFEGGATTFFGIGKRKDHTFPCVPKTGSVLIFEHPLWHEGSMLDSGRKYAVRTDVMYSASEI